MSRTFFSFFFCIVLVVSVPKNTNLLGWYLTSRIGCLVEVLNCWTFNLYVYRYTDTYKYMYIYIYILYVYMYIHIIYTFYSCTAKNVFFLTSVATSATHRRLFTVHIPKSISFTCCEPGCWVESATYFWTQGWVSFILKKPCETIIFLNHTPCISIHKQTYEPHKFSNHPFG